MVLKNNSALARQIYILLLVVASFGLVMWQAARIAPLVDISYMLESANRIFWGQQPYRDFYLVLPPGIFYIMSWVMEVFGKDYSYQLYFLASSQGGLIVATYVLLRRYNKDTLTSCLLTLITALGGHAILPFPSYDIPAALSVTLALLLFLECDSAKSYFVLGILSFAPVLFKQNVGLVFLCSLGGILFIKFIVVERGQNFRHFIAFCLGVVLALSVFLLWLVCNDSLHAFYFQCFEHPSRSRNPADGALRVLNDFTTRTGRRFAYPIAGLILAEYFLKLEDVRLKKNGKILFEISKKQIKITAFAVNIFLVSHYYIYRFLKEPTMEILSNMWSMALIFPMYWAIRERNAANRTLAVFVIVAVCLTSFLSQGFWGSSYGIWGLFSILLGIIFSMTSHSKIFNIIIIALIAIVMAGGVYTNDRLRYVSITGKVKPSSLTYLKQIGTPGNWLEEIQSIEHFVSQEIPSDEGFVQIPGEDPLYYTTDREPQLKYFQLNSTTFFHDSLYVAGDLRKNNIKWVIVKTKLQDPEGFISTTALQQQIDADYELYQELNSYKIYKVKD